MCHIHLHVHIFWPGIRLIYDPVLLLYILLRDQVSFALVCLFFFFIILKCNLTAQFWSILHQKIWMTERRYGDRHGKLNVQFQISQPVQLIEKPEISAEKPSF